MHFSRMRSTVVAVLLASCVGTARGVDSPADAFTYQGFLQDANGPANGNHDLFFSLVDANGGVIRTLCADNVPVAEGRFTVQLQVGPELPNLMREAFGLRVSVRPDAGSDCGDESNLQDLVPDQPLTSAPRAALASVSNRAGMADTVAGFTVAQLTNASNLTGTVPDAALAANVPRLNTSNVFAGTNVFTNIQTSGAIDNPTGPLQLRSNGSRGLLIDFRAGHANITAGSSSNVINAPAFAAAISGGMSNAITAPMANIGGGASNTVTAAGDSATIGGGSQNQAQAFHATIGGGYFNSVSGANAVVSGGALNSVSANFGTISGGASADPLDPFNTNNRVTDDFGVIGGGGGNRAGDDAGSTTDRPFATVSGGRANTADGPYTTVGGGSGNRAGTQFATVGGGVNNRALGGGFVTIAGGSENQASGFVATIGGGDFNNASGDRSVIAGGNGNVASGPLASVAGGAGNLASGAHAHVAGGLINQATGVASFAAGWGARAVHDGAFVWADSAQSGAALASTAPNEFTVRAAGGARFLGSGNAPRLTIEPSGGVVVPGTLVAGDVAFAAPRTRFRSYSAGAFVGSAGEPIRLGTWEEMITGEFDDFNTDAFSRLHLPLDLPHGARITGIRFTVRDTDANRWMIMDLVRTSLNDGSATSIANTTTQPFVGNGIPVEMPIAPPIVVDNANSALEILIEPQRSGALPTWSTGLGIFGVRIQYTVSSPEP